MLHPQRISFEGLNILLKFIGEGATENSVTFIDGIDGAFGARKGRMNVHARVDGIFFIYIKISCSISEDQREYWGDGYENLFLSNVHKIDKRYYVGYTTVEDRAERIGDEPYETKVNREVKMVVNKRRTYGAEGLEDLENVLRGLGEILGIEYRSPERSVGIS